MKKILSVDNMRRSDAHTIETESSGRELMLRAGRAVFENVDWKPPVAIVCGSGNNAGDGYVIAGLLHDEGIDCTIILLEDKFSSDGRYYYDRCLERGITSLFFSYDPAADPDDAPEGDRPGTSAGTLRLSGDKEYSTIVDCIFGTGFHGEVKGVARTAINAINASGAYVVSVDINSGLNGDTGMAKGQNTLCVRSDLTISIGSFKPGHFLNMAKDVMKRKINCDIGIEPVEEPFYLVEDRDIAPFFKKRPEYSNKGTYGYIALIGGSKRYSGAIRLAYMANAAMRSGAGVVKVAVPGSLFDVIASNVLESTLFPLSDEDGEMIFNEKEFIELTGNTKALAFGMGIGVTENTEKALLHLLTNYNGRMIVDADGLTLLSKLGKDVIKDSKAQLVLTPHIKEFSRLTGRTVDEILACPVETAREYAAEYGVILLLKGPSTIITDGETVYITDTGCSGMATAGSGDVLSGILAAVCAYIPDAAAISDKGKRLLTAAAAGAFINGRAGELAESRMGSVSMIASDTAACICEVITGLS